MKQVFRTLCILLLIILLDVQVSYAFTKSEVQIVYNTKVLELGDKNTVLLEDSLYIPLRVFSEQLSYKVDWNSEQKVVRIYDDLNNIYLYTTGLIEVNGIESSSKKKPLIIQSSVYVPLRFISENLGVSVEWKAKEKKVYMTGKSIYEVSSTNALIAYTNNGKKVVKQLGDQSTLKPVIEVVTRTNYSDIVTTTSESSGAITTEVNNQMYIRNGELIYSTTDKSENKNLYSGKQYGVKYYDNKVAFLTHNIDGDYLIKIFNDQTGTLTKIINTTKEYGEVRNIQGIGDGWIVVNMAQQNKLSPVLDLGNYYMTTVIDLTSNKATPIYEKVNNPLSYTMIASNASMYMTSGMVVTDGIYLSNKAGTELNFLCLPSSSESYIYKYSLK